jgi:hypothetical protein
MACECFLYDFKKSMGRKMTLKKLATLCDAFVSAADFPLAQRSGLPLGT